VAIYCDKFDPSDPQRELHRHVIGMDFMKSQPQGLPRFLHLGFEELCRFTGEPVVGRDRKGDLLGKICQIREKYAEMSHQELQEKFWKQNPEIVWNELPNLDPSKYEFPKELDLLGGDEGKNYIAIIHIDANSMGDAFKTLQQNLPIDKRDLLRQLSEHIKVASEQAVQFITHCLAQEIEASYSAAITHRIFPPVVGPVSLNQKEGKILLPLRPILQGGDDLTFICDGRLGLCLATGYMNKFQRLTHEFLQQNRELVRFLNAREDFTACAGVAIVKAHYPFRHAYALSEALLKSAKKIGRKSGYNALDFHIVSETSRIELEHMRAHEYIFQEGAMSYSLTRKPYYVGNAPASHSDHPPLASYYQNLGNARGLIAHSKLKELEAAVHQGPKETKRLAKYLQDTYKPPQDSQKNKHDLEEWIQSLSGTGELENSFFQINEKNRATDLLDIMEGESLLAQKEDFFCPNGQGLRQDIFWS